MLKKTTTRKYTKRTPKESATPPLIDTTSVIFCFECYNKQNVKIVTDKKNKYGVYPLPEGWQICELSDKVKNVVFLCKECCSKINLVLVDKPDKV